MSGHPSPAPSSPSVPSSAASTALAPAPDTSPLAVVSAALPGADVPDSAGLAPHLAVGAFDDFYPRFAALVGQYGSAVLPGCDLAATPGLRPWLIGIRDAYRDGTLGETQVAMMEALRDWEWLSVSGHWLNAFRDFEALAHSPTPPDLTQLPDPSSPAPVAWAREQQLARAELTEAQVVALERVPGWCWQTRPDRVAAHTDAICYLAHRGSDAAQMLAWHVWTMPADTLAAMLRASESLCTQVDTLLTIAETDGVRERGAQFAAALTHLSGPYAEEAARYIAENLDEFTSGDLPVRDLAGVHPELATVVLAAWSAYRATRPRDEVAAPVETAPIEGGDRRHVSSLGLSVRTYNVLMREGYHRVGDLLAVEDPNLLLALRGFGVTCLADLRERLREAGLSPSF